MWTAIAEMLNHVDAVSGFETREAAEAAAYEMAWELYATFEGMHGVGIGDMIEDYIEEHGEEPTEEEEHEMRNDDFETWVSYWTELTEEYEDDL